MSSKGMPLYDTNDWIITSCRTFMMDGFPTILVQDGQYRQSTKTCDPSLCQLHRLRIPQPPRGFQLFTSNTIVMDEQETEQKQTKNGILDKVEDDGLGSRLGAKDKEKRPCNPACTVLSPPSNASIDAQDLGPGPPQPRGIEPEDIFCDKNGDDDEIEENSQYYTTLKEDAKTGGGETKGTGAGLGDVEYGKKKTCSLDAGPEEFYSSDDESDNSWLLGCDMSNDTYNPNQVSCKRLHRISEKILAHLTTVSFFASTLTDPAILSAASLGELRIAKKQLDEASVAFGDQRTLKSKLQSQITTTLSRKTSTEKGSAVPYCSEGERDYFKRLFRRGGYFFQTIREACSALDSAKAGVDREIRASLLPRENQRPDSGHWVFSFSFSDLESGPYAQQIAGCSETNELEKKLAWRRRHIVRELLFISTSALKLDFVSQSICLRSIANMKAYKDIITNLIISRDSLPKSISNQRLDELSADMAALLLAFKILITDTELNLEQRWKYEFTLTPPSYEIGDIHDRLALLMGNDEGFGGVNPGGDDEIADNRITARARDFRLVEITMYSSCAANEVVLHQYWFDKDANLERLLFGIDVGTRNRPESGSPLPGIGSTESLECGSSISGRPENSC
ncbi:hypothetical protein BJ508DRAFT_313417 [Ascobolus immersus RN42]|uniref:Uncharacterized protein n=1 Tax=Ascobolus immersus RN42 TaxID=1160509 RepID=A0A3N4HMV4_ASCIM|nr:hypothetical protein BJ508DRAFT_313417 [Ascobolus immersus RN42]